MDNSLKTQIKAVALDFDGVITNLDVNWHAVIRQASKIVGHDIKSLILFYENNFGSPIFQKVSVEMEKIELTGIRNAEVAPFFEEFLQQLSKRQIQIYIVSMQSFKVIKTFLDQHGLVSYFNGVITREKCPSKAAQVQFISKQADINLNEILLVDDSKRNINNCKALGAACFYFERKPKPKDAEKAWNEIVGLIKLKG